MYDPRKPDLIVHPMFYKTIERYDLNTYYNLIPIENLTYNFNIKPILITDKTSRELRNVLLKPFFKYPINSMRSHGTKFMPTNTTSLTSMNTHLEMANHCESPVMSYASAKPENTSFYFERQIPIYTIEENGPRYVIWTKNDPLTICGTFVNRIDIEDIYQAYQRAKLWAHEINYTKSIIVFDLDDTLINNDTGRPFKCANHLLKYARNAYDLMVLYSHGSSLHVDQHLQLFNHANGVKFDLVLSNNMIDKRSTKNLLSLYNHFPNTRFKNATLVDDSLYNWSPEYNKFIVPSVKVTLKHALPFIC
ncbi:38K protein [Esparto virus]|uniref:38K protein n=1 Tax=Esparto virus TaxID=2072209 RepID=A0A2I7G2X2_9VIRU|nr:38K protein [Esparto virus]AUQ43992.1 38K protein [Esparto virus]